MEDRDRSAGLEHILQWQAGGGTWRVVSLRNDVIQIALCRRDGVEVERVHSADPDLLHYARHLH